MRERLCDRESVCGFDSKYDRIEECVKERERERERERETSRLGRQN